MPSTLVSAALAAAVALAVAPPAPAAAPALSCTYTLTRWSGGFTAELSIANSGPTITGWTAHWTFGTPTRITSSWQAALTQITPNDTVAAPMPWLATIPSGGAVSFGWTAIAATTEVPDDIAINGQRC
jgi:galactose mutarotase-like enzyme